MLPQRTLSAGLQSTTTFSQARLINQSLPMPSPFRKSTLNIEYAQTSNTQKTIRFSTLPLLQPTISRKLAWRSPKRCWERTTHCLPFIGWFLKALLIRECSRSLPNMCFNSLVFSFLDRNPHLSYSEALQGTRYWTSLNSQSRATKASQ